MSERDEGTRTVRVSAASGAYDVVVGAGVLARAGELVRAAVGERRCCVVSETNVAPLYADALEASLGAAGLDVAERVVFPAGEAHKDLATLGEILEALSRRELTRDDVVVALGGGVCGDMAGLAGALYLRGLAVVQVPTSLLAMVDSSVGGKTAVDLPTGKNLVGAFWQPRCVVADVRCLASVDEALFRDSCGEVVKHAVLADPAMLDELLARPLAAGDEARLVRVVARNVEIKRDVVDADERERGLRQTLNLGHTIGHAIEAASDFTLGHGSCVAAGLCMMARASAARRWCEPACADKIAACAAAHGLPTTTDVATGELMGYVAHDKKRHGSAVNAVIIRDVGRVEVRRMPLSELAELIELGR